MLGTGNLLHWNSLFGNISQLDSNLGTASDLGFFSFTKGFITLCLPNLDTLKMKLTPSDSLIGRKRSVSEGTDSDVNLMSESIIALQKRSSSQEMLGDSTEDLLAESGQNFLKKLVKLREKIITNQHLNLKKLFAARKRKRCVSFADDKGLPLEDVRVVEEEEAACEVNSTTGTTTDGDNDAQNYSLTPWIMAFFQPIFSKKKMRQTFAEKGVALETVDIENTRLSGTIKVNSASTNRKVFVRYTKDSWKTYCDILARQLPNDMDCSLSDSQVIYYFEMNIPDSVLHVQFAVCLSDSKGHRWDDNTGSNYILLHHSCLGDDSGSHSESEQVSESKSTKLSHTESNKVSHTDSTNDNTKL